MASLTTAAEDYYGNDYPEDEVDFDDEFDRDAYKYRNDASDEEEFDEDYDGRSDDEHPRDRLWKRSSGGNRLKIFNDSEDDEAS